MKNLILASILVVIVLLGSFFLYKYIENTSGEFSKTIEEVELLVNENRWEDAAKKFEQFNQEWEPSAKIWMIIIGHEEIDHIEQSLLESRIYIRKKNNESLVELSLLKYYLEHIYQKEKLKLHNIF